MNKLRLIRFKNMTVDMTAMCDVAFLLLVFFVLTARFKPYEPMKISLPAYTNRIADDFENNNGIIYIADGKVMFEIADEKLRKQTLLAMGNKYHISFSVGEQELFIKSPVIGASISQLKQYDQHYLDFSANENRPGITYGGELYNWIREARVADRAINDKDLRIIIKADKSQGYPVIKQVVAILQKQNINKFSLLTDTKSQNNIY